MTLVALSTVACTTGTRDHGATLEAPPGRPARGITLVLAPTSDGRCCIVTTVNPEDAEQIVLCFVEAFDAAGHLLTTLVVPPIPTGHRRSSGFVAPPGRQVQGRFDLPAELVDHPYLTTCRPAAWHGGAPI